MDLNIKCRLLLLKQMILFFLNEMEKPYDWKIENLCVILNTKILFKNQKANYPFYCNLFTLTRI